MNTKDTRDVDSRPQTESDDMSSDQFNPKYYHGQHNEYKQDLISYVRKRIRKQENSVQHPRLMKRSHKIPDSREFLKIGEENKVHLHPNKRNSTAGSGFPLLKDALNEELIRQERKKRYAEELMAQVARKQINSKNRLPHKVTSSQAVIKYFKNEYDQDDHWYEYNPEPSKLSFAKRNQPQVYQSMPRNIQEYAKSRPVDEVVDFRNEQQQQYQQGQPPQVPGSRDQYMATEDSESDQNNMYLEQQGVPVHQNQPQYQNMQQQPQQQQTQQYRQQGQQPQNDYGRQHQHQSTPVIRRKSQQQRLSDPFHSASHHILVDKYRQVFKLS